MPPLIWAEIAPYCQTKISLGDRQTSGWGTLDDQMCFPTLDEEGIGSTIIIFCHKINVVLLKKKRYTHCGHCKEDFRGGECLEEHVVLFMKRDLL